VRRYLAPEQTTPGREVGPAADVYALGGVLHFLLTGRDPFARAGAAADPGDGPRPAPAAPRRHKPKVPPQLFVVCLNCLRKEPADRYPSAAALAEVLRRHAAEK
jgi:serine/threonine protein kinase